jgi:hypothetical protein
LRKAIELCPAFYVTADAGDRFKSSGGEIGIGDLNSKFLLEHTHHVGQSKRIEKTAVEQGFIRTYFDGLLGNFFDDGGDPGL